MYHSAAAALAALLVLLTPATAHSWVEEMDVIDPTTGTFTGSSGYCRNNTKRTVPGFSDPLMVHILPSAGQPTIEERDTIPALDTTGIYPNDTMCKHSQQAQYQSNDSPRLQAAPGDLVALRYQENGHVTLPQNQPGKQPNRGWVYIYGTTQPNLNGELFLDVFGQWNEDGSGGDKRGKLLAKQPFDDGFCYQVNSGNISTQRQAEFAHTPNQLMGANLWCQNNIALPTDAPTGKPYVLYWVWDWPTEPGVDPNLPKGKAELYTTCMDVDIVAKPGRKRHVKVRQAPPSPSSPSSSIDRNSAAIPAYVSSLVASPAPAGASPVVSAQASPASPEPTMTPSAGAQVAANPTIAAESYIKNAVSAAIVAEAPKVPLTVTIEIVESVMLPTAGAAATAQPAGVQASTPAASPANNTPAATQAASPALPSPPPTTSTPAQAPAVAPSSMPPTSLDINPPILSPSPPGSTLPGFSGTATPVVASPAVAATSAVAAGAATNQTSAVMASGASQNGTMAGKGQHGCSATTCKTKRRSKIFGKKGGGQRL